MNPVAEPGELESLLGRDREAHIYGLADLEEPLWSSSTWYAREDVAVGLVSDGTDWVTGYAMSRIAPKATLDLLVEVHPELPSGTWITGATGLFETLGPVRSARPIGIHWRMVLHDTSAAEDSSEVSWLGEGDFDAMVRLHASDPRGAFWLPTMLASNPFVGIWEGDRLVASAGCHVASRAHGVAAIGAVFTAPTHRGRGLGRVVTSALCRRIADDYRTIGLNVEATNSPALAIYDSLGFRRAFQYEEIQLL